MQKEVNIKASLFHTAVIVIIIEIISSYYQIKTDFPNDLRRVSDEFAWVIICYMFLIFPAFAVELSCIRSVYKLLKYKPNGIVKTCYIISAGLALVAFVFQCLVFSGVIDLVGDSGTLKYQQSVLFLTEWPIFLISMILGSIKQRDGKCKTGKTISLNSP